MALAQSKHEFFHKGVDAQKRPDIVIDLKRPSPEKMMEWSPEEKKDLPEFIATCERVFERFIGELKTQINIEVCTCSDHFLAAHGECYKCPGKHTRVKRPTKK